MTTQTYVTPEGLVAALSNPAHLSLIREAIEKPRPQVVRKALRRGWVAPERRTVVTRGTYTGILLNGVIDRVVQNDTQSDERVLVRYTVTGKKPASLGPALSKVYRTIALLKEASTPELFKALSRMEPNTIRWAVQILRQTGLVKTVRKRSAA